MTTPQRRDLLEILEDRYGRASTLVTSQIPIERWYDIIAEPTMADAILDRLVHNAHKITLKGESMRKRDAERLDDKPRRLNLLNRQHKGHQTVRLRSNPVAAFDRTKCPPSIEFTDRLHRIPQFGDLGAVISCVSRSLVVSGGSMCAHSICPSPESLCFPVDALALVCFRGTFGRLPSGSGSTPLSSLRSLSSTEPASGLRPR